MRLTTIIKPAAAGVALIALSGCAHQVDAGTLLTAQQRLTCATAAQCDAMWSLAVTWMATRAPLRVAIQTDTLVQTYPPPPGDDFNPEISVSMLKDEHGGGRIVFFAGPCRLTCLPARVYEEAAFKGFVVTGP